MSVNQTEKKYGNTLHPDTTRHRWLSSESAVEFSTNRSSGSWIGFSEKSYGNNLLPPLRDAITGRNKFISASFTAGQEQHLDIQHHLRSGGRRRLSLQTNKRIVSHLRRRLRHRLTEAFVDELSSSDGEGGEEENNEGLQSPTKRQHEVDIFSKYNDIGGRLSKEGETKDGNRRKSAHDVQEILLNQGETPTSARSHIPRVQSPKKKTKDSISEETSNDTNNNDDDDKESKENDSVIMRLQVSVESKDASSSSVKSSDSSISLPKINVKRPHSPKKGSATLSLSPDIKLPAIADGRSLVSPELHNKTKVTFNDEDLNSKKDEQDLDGIEESESSQNSGGDSYNHTDIDALKDLPSSSPISSNNNDMVVHQVEEKSTELSIKSHEENQEQSESSASKGFGSFDVISPVPTPQPLEYLDDVADVDVNLADCREQIYQGCLDSKWPIPTRIVRIYVSSTFLDFDAERTALVSKCYPVLRSLCRQRGYEFQVCDLRWGVYDTLVDDHSFSSFCLQQLKSCQSISASVNFVSFLGHKYGQLSIPPKISPAVFEAVLAFLQKERDKIVERRKKWQNIFISESAEAPRKQSVLGQPNRFSSLVGRVTQNTAMGSLRKPADGKKKAGKESQANIAAAEEEEANSETESEKSMDEKDIEKEFETNMETLKTWFQLDENVNPPVYQLQNISSQYRDITSGDRAKKQRARNQWLITQKRLKKIFTKYMKKTEMADSDSLVIACSKSVNAKEVEEGILNVDGDLHDKALFFRRYISDLKSNLQDYAAKHYIDLYDLKPEINTALVQKVEDIKENKVPSRMSYSNMYDLSVDWFKEGIDPSSIRHHSIYIDRLAAEFTEAIKSKIEKNLDTRMRANAGKLDHLTLEVCQHLNLVHDRCKTFYGRKDTLMQVKQYLLSDSNQPMVIYGATGSGKTSIIAKAAQLTRQWLKMEEATLVIRCIGHTPISSNMRTLIHGISQQICHAYDMDQKTVPQDYFGALNDFLGRLSVASADKPLVIFLDGLDQLSTEHSAHAVSSWLPKHLPDHVHLIVSTSSTSHLDILKELKKYVSDNNLLEVPDLSDQESQVILDNLLRSAGRVITQTQRDVIMAGVEANLVPLYVELAVREATLWQSSAQGRQLFLPNQMNKLVNGVFMRLETTHSEPLVRRALGYITAANHGVTWTELEDLLSLDDAVMTTVTQHHGTSVRRLPSALWCRLRQDIEPYLNVSIVDNMETYRWCHQLFHQVATERYLNQRDKALSYHTAFVEYYLGNWVGVPKPYQGSEIGADRLVDEQPLMWKTVDGATMYNLRKLTELPYHLLQANQMDVLKTQTLFNYEFTLCKLKATSLFDVLDDLHRALTVQPNDEELRLLSDTLHLSTSGLMKDPNQLASQLIGRLYNMIEDDKPVMIGDVKQYPMMHDMLNQANRSSVPALIPSKTCLAPPGGVLNDLLAGHTHALTAVAVNSSGDVAATASLDGSVKLWNLCNRKVIQTINMENVKVSNICFCSSDQYIATVQSSNDICVWHINRGSQILAIAEYIDPPIISTAGMNNQYLVAFYSGSNVMRTWEISGDSHLVKEHTIAGGRSIHKDESVVLSQRSNGNKVLYAFRSDSRGYVVDATTGDRIHELQVPGEAAAVTALSMSKDYYILACRYQYLKLSEIHNLELFDIQSGSYLRAIRGCTQDCVSELFVNKLGSHAVCLSPSIKSNTTHIAVWNLETDDHKHLAKHPQISSMGACTDLSYCISASKQDKVLSIWNLSKKVNERERGTVATAKTNSVKCEGIEEIVPMRNNPRYVVAKSINNGPLTVWNVVKGKCAVSPVTIERGLVDVNDVVLVRNHYVVVLSDKGISSVSDRPIQVYQTVYIYNMKTKKYIRKLAGVFIIPSPAHEYKILEGELLLGLSESRDHLIVWDLVTGHMKCRIKNSFKELWRGLSKEEEEARMRPKRNTTARMPAWDRRSETIAARTKRREHELEEERTRLDNLNMEKENTIEQFMITEDEKLIVCSYFAHHLCVFDVATQVHVHTLEDQNSMLHLYNAAMTPTGSHLVHVNYDDYEKYSYVTLWDLHQGCIKKRLRNEPNVCCIGLNQSATRVFFGNERNTLKIWDVHGSKSSLRKLKGYPGMELKMSSKIFMIQDGACALVFANDISLWDLNKATRLAMFSPDIRITDIHVIPGSQLVALALHDNPDCITLRLKGLGIEADPMDTTEGEELFGETTGESSDEEDEEEVDEDEKSGGDNNSVKSDNL